MRAPMFRDGVPECFARPALFYALVFFAGFGLLTVVRGLVGL